MADAEIEVIRRQLASHPRPADLAERRWRLDALGQQYSLPPDVRVEKVSANGVAAEWTTTPQANPARVILFLHGGGYISGSLDSHRHMIAEAGRQAGARTLALDYRLAPEHPFPAALEDAMAGYRFLLAQGIAPAHVAMAGESAGGGCAVAALVALRDAGVALPGCLWCSSPWVDLAVSGGSIEAKAAVDPLLGKPYLLELAAAYLHGADPLTPLASPLHADLRGLPAMLIQVGSAETLLDDAVRLAGVAGGADVPVTLRIWPDMIHAWHLFYQQVAAGRRALVEVGAFIHAALG
ncbi:alpha/beta hydrolase [Siccirubricoccus sp. G192]|uniref:alpha/beta hydrolase n=1 Tax=Siccirubricoccus sp. G192 TaxID=2849651 RepID=UPI001C2CAFB8|nr:alpha/beta hydrolase [Siccirubricoccus sp. G192]MBV1799410.1 alpha/beta hydrolase [Siccirubricoccus sp. G192]